MASMDKVARFYNRIASLYPLIDLGLRPYKKYLVKELKQTPNGTLLDIGTGQGAIFGLGLSHQITGIDFSSKMLEIARRKHPSASFTQMNACELTFENESYDYVVLAHVLSTTDTEMVLSEVERVLKPKGKAFVLNHFSPAGILGIPSRVFSAFSQWFAFSSSIRLKDVLTASSFKNNVVLAADKWGFYKLIIFTKE